LTTRQTKTALFYGIRFAYRNKHWLIIYKLVLIIWTYVILAGILAPTEVQVSFVGTLAPAEGCDGNKIQTFIIFCFVAFCYMGLCGQ